MDDGHRPILKHHLSNQAKRVTSRVFTRKTAPPTTWRPYWALKVTSRMKRRQPPWQPGFSTDLSHFQIQLKETNVLTKFHTAPSTGGHFHDDWAKIVTSRLKSAPPTGRHFRTRSRYHWTNRLTKFHEDRTRNVASRVFTMFLYSQIKKTAPPTGGHVF
ncbi:hypothetical protein DPMN_169280 [Dreissena polymorpha]|uniref:Uncharacterized protein n=1 Tax=Dreissena polymorpha TaxID=45954 RepID=A0A9D4F4B6_DREPO|nr:hypothetical protein DPMN_169280 [Dreissena polymorpha]